LISLAEKGYYRASDELGGLEHLIGGDLNTARDVFEDSIIFLFIDVSANNRLLIYTVEVRLNDSLNVSKDVGLLVLVFEKSAYDYS
jgi:hypothetical protein